MKIIETKTTFIENLDLMSTNHNHDSKEHQAKVEIMHKHLAPIAKGFWDIFATENPTTWEFRLTPTSDEIKAEGYKWKEYWDFFETTDLGKRQYGTAPVGFKYAG